MRKTIALSGGKDSAMVAKKLKDDGVDLECVFLNVGQDNVDAMRVASQEGARRYGVGWHEVTVDLGDKVTYWFNQTTGEYSWTPVEGWTKSTCPNWHQILVATIRGKALALDTTEVIFGHKTNSITSKFLQEYEAIDAEQIWRTIRPTVIFPIYTLTTYQEVADWANADLSEFDYCV